MEEIIENIIKELNIEMKVSNDIKEEVDSCYREILTKHLI